jgi:hypothetical protein
MNKTLYSPMDSRQAVVTFTNEKPLPRALLPERFGTTSLPHCGAVEVSSADSSNYAVPVNVVTPVFETEGD